ncbi:hypothetical protein PIROE2DRAFT_9228, partial [Piromyces sp. E2]
NFKVIAIKGTPSVKIGGKTYTMAVDEYPVYNVTVDVNTPVTYRYVLDGKTESFDRTLETGTETLNEFYDRTVTVKYHPELPKAFESYPTMKNSKLYD